MTEQAKKITFDFSILSVFEKLELRPEQEAERTAARYVFEEMCSEDFCCGNKALNNRTAVEATVEKIKFRLNMFDAFAEEFFSDAPFNRDAVLLVTVCNDLLDAPDELNAGSSFHHILLKYFSDEDICEAVQIQEAASCLLSVGEDDAIPAETLFAAHLNTLERMEEIGENFSDYTDTELQEIKEEKFPLIMEFLRPDTEIGQQLLYFITNMDGLISATLPTAKIYQFPPRKLPAPSL